MADMLVKLFHLQPDLAAEAALLQNGVCLCRACLLYTSDAADEL